MKLDPARWALGHTKSRTDISEVMRVKKLGIVVMATLFVLFATAGMAVAQDAAAGAAKPSGANSGLLGLAAALAVGLGAIGTAWAQSRIGAAAAGAIAERPEMGGLMLVFLALPETMVILGFLVAFFVIGKI
jgi:V/A-type H+-transporting ATPase subunit K